MGLIDGIAVSTRLKTYVFALPIKDIKALAKMISCLNPSVLPGENLNFSEGIKFNEWLHSIERKKNPFLTFLVLYLLVAPGLSILWQGFQMVFPDIEFFRSAYSLILLSGLIWFIDLSALLIYFSIIIFKGPFHIVKLYGLLVLLIGSFMIMPILYFYVGESPNEQVQNIPQKLDESAQ